ncbi:GNAT family N-acetyltransferase [Novosphingobium sp. KCTC 2891]|uniref:GNAT family N-acetyltransferase n=1 Tax=Novosphingobium sp. KCTC 2891 TaxID=2989730 RepID=UPI002223709A|nr:GNAT family N-acetyltransferase [Novosphingobium sp. KCTC 2891]MCW1382348.1 GNAT family N-acetyltransferase [Novosphingobium sp. KCTC 2891]
MSGPVLVTERLELWRPQAGDHAGLVDLLAPEAVRRNLGARPTSAMEEFNRLLRNAGSWALYGYGIFTCRLRGDDSVIGICGVFHSWRGFGKGMDDTPEIGWIFAERAWGKGIASEAAAAAIGWFETAFGPRRIACMINDTNVASVAVAEKLGFVRCGEHDDGDARLILLERNG